MSDERIENDLREYIQKEFMAGKSDVELTNDLSLVEAGVLDSLAIFTLIAYLEERFGVKVESEDVVIENFDTIDALRELVLQRTG